MATWQAREKERLLEQLAFQRLTLRCGIGGCLVEFAGLYLDVIAARDVHRVEKHRGWVRPPEPRFKRRRVAAPEVL